MKNVKFLSLSLIYLAVLSCTNLPETEYYEVDGIVSIEARNISDGSGWEAQYFQTSKPAVSLSGSAEQSEPLTANFYIRNPGIYSIWTLSAKISNDSDENYIPVRITNDDGFLLLEDILELPSKNRLEWGNRSQRTGEELFAEFDSPGVYQISYLPDEKSGYKIDKIHLTLNNERIPEGRGLPETSSPSVDPVLAKRDQPVVIPPAWAFGTLLGEFENHEEAGWKIQTLMDEEIGFDVLWLDNDPEFETNLEAPEFFDILKDYKLVGGMKIPSDKYANAESIFQTGAHFSVFDEFTDIETVRRYFETSQRTDKRQNSRGFILAPMNIIFDPDFKLYPSIKSTNSIINPGQYDDVNRYGMDVLKSNIEMVSNARLSTYEIPFMVPGLDFGERFESSYISEELFLRWIQFGAFNSMFNISGINSNVNFETLSGESKRQFRELTHLRNRLFPYIYSIAHFTRAGGLKPVRGDGNRATQFLLGEAFLIAPIYELDADQRTVYFPDGTWYNYWDGTVYNGGQSWIVEASTDKIPVFVKAGSIVPYRDYSHRILEGSDKNLTIEVYGDGVSSFRLYEDDGITTNYQLGEFSTTAFRYFEHDNYATFTIGRMVRAYEGQPESKNLELRFRYIDEPDKVTVNGNSLQKGEGTGEWLYSEHEEILYIYWEQPNYQKTDFRIEFTK